MAFQKNNESLEFTAIASGMSQIHSDSIMGVQSTEYILYFMRRQPKHSTDVHARWLKRCRYGPRSILGGHTES
jgi:hypothetical protein